MKKGILILSAAMLLFAACKRDGKTVYEAREATELASGVRHDSIFLGMFLGMNRDSFYNRCFELNKQKLIREGAGNASVLYKLDTPTMRLSADMSFYPNLYDLKVWQMPVIFKYESWAPWVRAAQPDSLQLDVLRLMEGWYGGGFIKVKEEKRGLVFKKIDGNRRVEIWQQPEMFVKALITDVKMEKTLRDKGELPN